MLCYVMNIVNGFNTYLDLEQLQCQEEDKIMLRYEHCTMFQHLPGPEIDLSKMRREDNVML